MAKEMRLDKFLCEMGIGSRSQVKQELKKKKVTVNDEVITKPERKINPEVDVICYEGQPIVYAAYEYYLFHKPAGCVTATEDRRDRTVLDYLTDTVRDDLFPVGRLDKDTEGLLLITNDGRLAHRLLSPKNKVPKTYFAKIEGTVEESWISRFAEGLEIGEEKPTLPARLQIVKTLPKEQYGEVLLTITEGRFHQVKRMVQAVGGKVTYLKRLSMGPLSLEDSLAPGAYRKLTAEELERLRNFSPACHKCAFWK